MQAGFNYQRSPNLIVTMCDDPELDSGSQEIEEDPGSSGVVAWLNIASTELIVQGLQGRHGEER